jgi:hypothetical protein
VRSIYQEEDMTVMPDASRGLPVVIMAAISAGLLAGCSAGPTEYHGDDSGIDGVLWRQISSYEDPLDEGIYKPLDESLRYVYTLVPNETEPPVNDPTVYLQGIQGPRWDGTSASAHALGLENGGVAIYAERAEGLTAEFSVFIASGPRPDVPTDNRSRYVGPSEVYTCYGITVQFDPVEMPTNSRDAFKECPPTLVGLLGSDAAFASAEVFDG